MTYAIEKKNSLNHISYKITTKSTLVSPFCKKLNAFDLVNWEFEQVNTLTIKFFDHHAT